MSRRLVFALLAMGGAQTAAYIALGRQKTAPIPTSTGRYAVNVCGG